MKKIIISVVVILCMAIAIIGAFWGYGTMTLNSEKDSDVSDFQDAACFPDLGNKTGWISYSAQTIPGGSWYGGIMNDGTARVRARSSSLRTRVYIKSGAWDTKHWTGWSEIGERSGKDSSISVVSAIGGIWCGYEAKP